MTPVEKKLVCYLLTNEPDSRDQLDLIDHLGLSDEDAIQLALELGGKNGMTTFAQARAKMAEKLWNELPEELTWSFPGV